MIVEGYSIHLYCAEEGCRSGWGEYNEMQVGGRNKAEAWKAVRACGWERRAGEIYCPSHTKKAITAPTKKGES